MPDPGVYVEFMKKVHLFRGLSEDQLKLVAEGMEEQSCPEPETVFLQGTSADALYLIYAGHVAVIRREKKKEIKLATLVRGDYFGEQGLLTGQSRNATVKAEKGTVLVVLPREHFKSMLRKIPGLRANFEIMLASRQLANKVRFKWLADNEVIYFLARKHPVLLYQSLALPTVLMLLVFLILGLAFVYMTAIFFTASIFLGVAGAINLLWMIWKYVDWGNDFYIVTNQRVIWLEKVIGLYDSRNEASISTILSISTETDEIGRLFDYGTVVVRTFSGHIRMEYIRSPQQASAMIEEYWMRTKDSIRSNEQEGIKRAIRAKLGYAHPTKAPAPAPPAAKPQPKNLPVKTVLALRVWLRNAFKMRIEGDGVVTYRKHFFILIRNTFPYDLAFIILLSAPFLWGMFLGPPPLWLGGILGLLFVIDASMWGYEYVDWSNDTYQVTADQIIDIDRKPFGKEDRKAAPLENILSTKYERKGVFGFLFNFGTVSIMVGGAQFNFQDVADPPTVQQDIVRRQQVRVQKKRESETAGERERLAEWLAMYHQVQHEQTQSRPKNPE
ncbi:MAG: cyclic nucleotide-binding domain-containing protein [Anaerolineales bacterium]